MDDNHGGAAAVAVPIFPIAQYVLLISYLALVMVPFADLLDVLVNGSYGHLEGGVNRCYSNFNSFSNLGLTQR
jgi:hypothetical protein